MAYSEDEKRKDERIVKLEEILPSYIGLLKVHLATCPLDTNICSSCKFVRQMLAKAERLMARDIMRRYKDSLAELANDKNRDS